MPEVLLEQLLMAGSHFGHLTRKWNPKMKPYIFMERNGIHIIDLKKSLVSLKVAFDAVKEIVNRGEKVLLVGTKKQARDIIRSQAERCGMFYVTERWLGGTLTNFSTIKKSIKRLKNLEKMAIDGTFEKITKKEILRLTREQEKMEKFLGGIKDMNLLPGAVFIVDPKREDIAVAEAKKLNIPVFAILDTNCDPEEIDYPIPANDDAFKSIGLITHGFTDAILESMEELKIAEEVEAEEKEEEKEEKAEESKEA
ncbi:30S ribosomal protein S2 [candidate division KSB1 bacterium]|nr:30S ribosomal protein S2 [candidate division KSB1 bacterium]